jgi:quercetin dioxygenase-like cupin family protein
MFYRYEESLPIEMIPGLVRRTVADGGSMMICEFTLEKGVEIPVHAHPQEQIGYVVSGKLRITVNEESEDLGPGDCYYAPSGVQHGAVVLERAVVADTFSPPREDYRIKDGKK